MNQIRSLRFDGNDARLLWNFFKMNVRDKYLGSSLGSVWAILNPLLLVSIYTFVFAYVYRIQLPGSDSTLSQTIWLISGYGPWLALTESLTAGAMSLVAAAGLLKNMVFKSEILPVAAALTGMIPFAVCSALVSVLLIAEGNAPSWHIVFVLPFAVLQFGLVAALSFFFAVITIFIRDFAIALPNLLTIVLFATPIFYPIDTVPKIVRILSYANPVFVIADGYRQSLIYHRVPGLFGLVYVTVLTIMLGVVGLNVFRRLRSYIEARL